MHYKKPLVSSGFFMSKIKKARNSKRKTIITLG